MVSFENFIIEDGIPIYLQIDLHVKRGIAAGLIEDREELPSRRALSALLAINPNTVQKAYKILEDEGLMESQPGAKSIMRLYAAKAAAVKQELLGEGMERVVTDLQVMGLSLQESIDLLKKYWKEGEG